MRAAIYYSVIASICAIVAFVAVQRHLWGL